MGSYLSKMQEEVSRSLEVEYQMEAEPYLLHKQTQQLCTLHKITANSPQEADKIIQIIEQYDKSKCESISKLRSHYQVDKTGYCSDEQNFYLVFAGQNNYTIREEISKRKLYRTPFGDKEIDQILATLLCGLRQYDMRFQRHYDRLCFDSLVIDQKSNRIYLKDPWLNMHKSTDNDRSSHALAYYPSPQKLNATYANKLEDFNEPLANLFTVGVMALQLNKMEFMDGIYIRKRQINYDEVKVRVNQFKNERLRRGVQCLLNANPMERKKIYQIWAIENKEQHYLEPILTQKVQAVRSPSSSKAESYNRTSKFQFPPSSNPQPSLQLVPSETMFVPPLPIGDHQSATPKPPSTRSNPQKDYSQPHIFSIPQNHYENQRIVPQYHPFQIPHLTNLTYHPLHESIPKNVITIPPPHINYANQFPPSATVQQPLRFQQILARQQKKSSAKQDPVLDSTKAYNLQPRVPQINTNSGQPVQLPEPLIKPISIKEQQTVPLIKKASDEKAKLPENQLQVQVTTSEILKIKRPQKNADNPIEVREVTSFIVQAKPQYYEVVNSSPPIEKSQQKIQQTHNEDDKNKEPINNQAQQKAETTIPMIVRDNNETQAPKSNTPHRPTGRNKYNSTIVEVREEDSPAHSIKSEPREEEYVVEEYETGSRYEGFKSNNMRNGRGKFYYQDGGFYEGSWKNNKMDGYGKLYYEGGKLAYEGYWLEDEFNGLGKVYNDNPLPLEGSFDYTNFELLEDYWEYYEGMLVHDTKEGRGKIKLSNNELFEGDFHNDRIQGFGKFHNREGKTIEGIWRDSKLIKVINNTRA